jgi:hypothetical protein
MTLPRLSLKHMGPIGPKVLAIISGAVQSVSARVAEAALNFLTERTLETFIINNIRVIFPAVHGAIKSSATGHWSPEVRDLAKKTLNALSLVAPRRAPDVWRRESPPPDPGTWKVQSWVRIADMASINGAPTRLSPLEVAQTFGENAMPSLLESRRLRRSATHSQARITARGSMSGLPDASTVLIRPCESCFPPVLEEVRE